MTRIGYLTDVISPFWCDVANAAIAYGIDLKLLFNGKPSLAGRPAHWENWENADKDLARSSRVAEHGLPKHGLAEWYAAQLEDLRPDIVIASTYAPWVRKPALAYAQFNGLPLGLWAERPHPTAGPKRWLKEKWISHLLKGFDFCLAIGDRAVADYEAMMPRHGRTFLVPYGQSLSAFDPARRGAAINDSLRVLFSGQFISRHNFPLVVEAIKILDDELSGRGPRYLFSGRGPEGARLHTLIAERPDLGDRIEIYDMSFECFEDRATPYLMADVFLYPSQYSGWGLAVPEAMAAGLPVISTRNVEAARYYVEHGVNGIFVKEDAHAIASALRIFCDNPDLLAFMRAEAIRSSMRGRAEYVAGQLAAVLRYLGLHAGK